MRHRPLKPVIRFHCRALIIVALSGLLAPSISGCSTRPRGPVLITAWHQDGGPAPLFTEVTVYANGVLTRSDPTDSKRLIHTRLAASEVVSLQSLVSTDSLLRTIEARTTAPCCDRPSVTLQVASHTGEWALDDGPLPTLVTQALQQLDRLLTAHFGGRYGVAAWR
jgi:hypothetical protein